MTRYEVLVKNISYCFHFSVSYIYILSGIDMLVSPLILLNQIKQEAEAA